MEAVRQYLQQAVEQQASDILVVAGLPLSFKLKGVIHPQGTQIMMPQDTQRIITALFESAHRPMEKFLESGDDDFSLSLPGISRFRVSAYRQRGSMAAVIRVVNFELPHYTQIDIPEQVMSVTDKTRGLVLVTGPSGGGKTTTLACMIDKINASRSGHIVTLEDPIEYLHRNKKSIISQREIGADTCNYVTAMRACLRQTPDVILLGEMRDFETIQAAISAAETGHLVISTLHTMGAVNTVDRIVDAFAPNQQQQIKIQLSQILQTVISQQLLPGANGGLVPAFEIMHLNSAIRSMIRESKIHQIDSVIQSSGAQGMVGMDTYIAELYQSGKITKEVALKGAMNPEYISRKLN